MIALVPDVEEMAAELLQMRWRRRSKHLWVSPRGKYFIGVRDAWLAMKGVE